MYKKILVISDNVYLCAQFEKIIADTQYQNQQWAFAISPFSDKAIFESQLTHPVAVYDLKKDGTTQEISAQYDLVFSIHCKQIFPKALVESVKCINIHPGYNPINRGWYPQVFAIINDTPVGATIHEIDQHLDHGAIIDRALVAKRQDDTSLVLYNRIVACELELLEKNLPAIIAGTYTTIEPEGEGNLYLKSDFNALCQLDLNETLTMQEAINKMRALTHGSYKNAYFIDPETQEKIFVSIEFSK